MTRAGHQRFHRLTRRGRAQERVGLRGLGDVRLGMTDPTLLQHLGFTRYEIIAGPRAHDIGTASCDSEPRRLDAVVKRLDDKIAELRRTRRLVVLDVESEPDIAPR